jgi:hypothetical protein
VKKDLESRKTFLIFVLSKTNKMANLKIGDKVMWRGGFGSEPAKEATVTGIELCKSGQKYGEPCSEVDWKDKDRIVVDLDNGHWAKGHQLSPM